MRIKNAKVSDPLNPDHQTTQSLISAIEKKDRRFRMFQTFFMVGTFTILIILVVQQAQTLNSVRAQISNDAKLAAQTRQERSEQLNTITRRLDCMLVFFSQPDRNNLTVSDVDKCALSREDVGTFFTQPSTNGSATPSTSNNTAQQTPAATSTPATVPQQTTPQTPTQQPVATGGDDPNSNNNGGALGLGVCVLGICL